jgi:hypothetical protein
MPFCFNEVSDKLLFFVNVTLVVGIVFGLFFAIGINNENKKLIHENRLQRSKGNSTA